MSDIDTAAIRANWARATELYPDGLGAQFLGLCDEIDTLRAELEGEQLARIDAENGKRIANEYADAAEAKVAAVEALCVYNEQMPNSSVYIKHIRAAIGGPVDDA